MSRARRFINGGPGQVAGAAGWFTRRFTGSWRGGVALLILCLAVYVPGQRAIPPVDRDESRFAQASRQMVESGDWVVPRIQDRPRLNKPPLIYWTQAAAVALLGDQGRRHEGIWVYRLPSLLAAVATVLLTWRLGRELFDPRAAWLGAALLAAAPLFAWEAHQARADQLLVTTVVATQFALWRIWKQARADGSGGGRGDHGDPAATPTTTTPRASLVSCLALWTCLGAGIMTKGPITPMIAALTALTISALSRRWRWLLATRPLLGAIILAAIVGPWVWMVGEQVGWAHYLHTIYDETLGRAGAPKEGHWGPPGYHLIVLTVLFWPGTLLTAAAVITAARRALSLPPRGHSSLLYRLRHRTPGRSADIFLTAWILPSWLVFEFVSTKLPHYTMPLYPAIALVSARAVLDAASRPRPRNTGDRLGLAAWAAIGAVLCIALPLAAGFLLPREESWPAAAATLAAVFGAAALAVGLRTGLIVRTHVAGILAIAVTMATLTGLLLPRSPSIWISPRLTAAMNAADPARDRPLALVGYHEDSMLFLTRGRAQRLRPDDIAPWLAQHPTGLIAMPRETYETMTATLRPVPGPSSAVSGFNYSGGDPMDLVLVEAQR